MINVSEAFKEGVTAQSRRVSLKAIIDITPVNVQYGTVLGSTQSVNSKSEQIHDENTAIGRHAITSELNRWLIGKDFNVYTRVTSEESGFETSGMFNSTGAGNYYVEMNFSNVSVLQACHIYFPQNDVDGYAVNFELQVKQNNTVAYTKTITNNRSHDIFISGFTVYWPTSIKIIVTKWSLPNRRFRIPEIWLGMHDEWLDNMFASFSIQQKSSFTVFALPYTTCTVEIDNSDMRFDPTNKQSMFLSLEERQPIELFAAINDSDFYSIGTYYHYSGGWKTGNSALTMKWNLVDLIGLLVDRQFDTNGLTAPTILEGWIRAILGQLGDEFASLYEIPSTYSDMPITTTLDKIQGHTCGEVLQWVCQATLTWPRAITSGRLYVGRFERTGQTSLNTAVKLGYDNLESYPVLKANDDVARFDYKIGNTTYSVTGNSQSSPNTPSIDNPFIQSNAAALANAQNALQFYGGNCIETVGRGNPAQEIGDLVYVELGKGAFQPARVMEQTLEIKDHVLKSCKTQLLCIDPSGTYNSFVVLTEGTSDEPLIWSVPGNIALNDGVGKIKIVLVQAGWSGGHGEWVFTSGSGSRGDNGAGGKVNIIDNVTVTRGLEIQIVCGKAAEPRSLYYQSGGRLYYDTNLTATEGGHSTATINGNTMSSYNGQVYESGMVEPVSAKVIGRSSQWSPGEFSGDGGIGGNGGSYQEETQYDFAYDSPPSLGVKGADGCVIICYTVEVN